MSLSLIYIFGGEFEDDELDGDDDDDEEPWFGKDGGVCSSSTWAISLFSSSMKTTCFS